MRRNIEPEAAFSLSSEPSFSLYLVQAFTREHWKMKRYLRTVMCLVLMQIYLSGASWAGEIPIVTGVHWTTSSEEEKKAYLIGIANMVQIEVAYHGPASEAESVSAGLLKGLKGQTLDSVRTGLDNWYAAHSDRMQRPVIETIWFEMVAPELQKTRGDKP